MHQVPGKRRLLEREPGNWYELIFWNGNENKQQQYIEDGLERTTPERYRGWIQYGMWLMTPRVARQWNNHQHDRMGENGYWSTMKEIIAAVDTVHNDPVLRKFWRQGELVPNTEHENRWAPGWLGEDSRKANRYFLLDTSEHPNGTPEDWGLETKIPVFALARKIGDSPNREWLIYAHAPMGDKKNVDVEIPNYQTVSIDKVTEGGNFYHVKQNNSTVTKVGE
jgi:hypothetical protein